MRQMNKSVTKRWVKCLTLHKNPILKAISFLKLAMPLKILLILISLRSRHRESWKYSNLSNMTNWAKSLGAGKKMQMNSFVTSSLSLGWIEHWIVSKENGLNCKQKENWTETWCQRSLKYTRRTLNFQMYWRNCRERSTRRESLPRSHALLMINWESSGISRRLIIGGYNKKKWNWTMILGT